MMRGVFLLGRGKFPNDLMVMRLWHGAIDDFYTHATACMTMARRVSSEIVQLDAFRRIFTGLYFCLTGLAPISS